MLKLKIFWKFHITSSRVFELWPSNSGVMSAQKFNFIHKSPNCREDCNWSDVHFSQNYLFCAILGIAGILNIIGFRSENCTLIALNLFNWLPAWLMIMNKIVFESSPNRYISLWVSFVILKSSNEEVKLEFRELNEYLRKL